MARDLPAEGVLMPTFEFPHRWTEIAPLLLSGDPEKQNQAVAYLDDRDRAVEDWLNRGEHACRVWMTADFALPDILAFHIVPYDTVDYDDEKLFDTSTSRYTVPEPGRYFATAATSIITPANSERFLCSLFVNGSEVSRGYDDDAAETPTRITAVACDTLELDAGDLLDVRIRQVGGTARTLDGDAAGILVHLAVHILR